MSVEVKTPTRTQFEHVEFHCGEKQASTFHHSGPNDDKQKDDPSTPGGKKVTILDHQQRSDGPRQDSRQYQAKRRRFSVPSQRGSMSGPRYKRRYSSKQERIVLPTKFLLGGNISDPLNLNSLYDDATGTLLNEKTPNSSPLPFPTHRENTNSVFPPNITDPLNLNSGEDFDDFLSTRLMARKRRRHKHKKKQEDELNSPALNVSSKETEKKKNLTLALKIDVDTTLMPAQDRAESDSELVVPNQKKCEDKIVSPVIPQSSKSRKRRRTVSECSKADFLEGISNARRALLRTESVPFDHDVAVPSCAPTPKKAKRQLSASKMLQQTKQQLPERQRKNSNNTPKKFIYGNYNRYYGYRNPELEHDVRLDCLRPEWFEGKDVLDIGCNVGHVTLAVARDFRPRKIFGIDIDGKLIAAARKNIRYYLTSTTMTSKFPASVKLNYGPVVAPSLGDSSPLSFPKNIIFLQGNYVLEFDELLEVQKEEYDVIMALSITKWIHLNHGDSGMKRFFKRIFKQLRPGGRLILEPQAWPSYKKKKKLTEDIFSNFKKIKFKPDQFTDYLLSREVGFSTCEAIEVPFNKSVGFRRPIQLFTKPDTSVNSPNPCGPHTEAVDVALGKSFCPDGTGTANINTTCAKLPDNLTGNRETSVDVTDTSADITNTSADVTNTSAEVTDTRADVTDTRADIEDTSADVTDTRADMTDTRADVMNTSAHVADTSADITDTRADVPDTSADVSNTRADVTDTSADVTDTRADVMNTSADVADTSADIADTSADVTDTRADVMNTSADIADTSADVMDTRADIANTSADITDTSAKVTVNSAESKAPTEEVGVMEGEAMLTLPR